MVKHWVRTIQQQEKKDQQQQQQEQSVEATSSYQTTVTSPSVLQKYYHHQQQQQQRQQQQQQQEESHRLDQLASTTNHTSTAAAQHSNSVIINDDNMTATSSTPYTIVSNTGADLDALNLVSTSATSQYDDFDSFSLTMTGTIPNNSTSSLDLDGVKVVRPSGIIGGGNSGGGKNGKNGGHNNNRKPNCMEWIQIRMGAIIETNTYKRTVLVMILLCSIFLGVRTGNFWTNEQQTILDAILMGFLILFTLEVWIVVLHYQREVVHLGWVIGDIIILISSWLIHPTLLILRAFRLIRGLRRATGLNELKHLVQTLLRSLTGMASLALIAIIVYYMFAVLFTDLFGEFNYFRRLDVTVYTLFQIMTLDGWADITKEVIAVYTWSWILFLLFICVTTFLMGSLLVAIMCEAMNSAQAERMRKSLEMNGPISPISCKDMAPPPTPTIQTQETMSLGTADSQYHQPPPPPPSRPNSTNGNGRSHSNLGLPPPVPRTGSAGSNHSMNSQRIEKKVDDLAAAVEKLTKLQADLQESLVSILLTEQHQQRPQIQQEQKEEQQIEQQDTSGPLPSSPSTPSTKADDLQVVPPLRRPQSDIPARKEGPCTPLGFVRSVFNKPPPPPTP